MVLALLAQASLFESEIGPGFVAGLCEAREQCNLKAEFK